MLNEPPQNRRTRSTESPSAPIGVPAARDGAALARHEARFIGAPGDRRGARRRDRYRVAAARPPEEMSGAA